MKTFIKVLSFFIISVLLSACTDESIDEDKISSVNLNSYSLEKAKKYFYENANDLSPVKFNSASKRSTARAVNDEIVTDKDIPATSTWFTDIHVDLVPSWEDAIFSENKAVSMWEIPLRSLSQLIVKVNDHFEKESYSVDAGRRLVIAKRADGVTELFITTIIPDYAENSKESFENIRLFRYLGGNNFSGKVLCSTLDGKFVKAFGYKNGHQNGTLCTVVNPNDMNSQQAMAYTLHEIPQEQTCTYYGMEEPGDKIEGEGGMIDGGMFPDIDITACPYCHETNGCICLKCPQCGKKAPECMCSICEKCGQKPYECTCYRFNDTIPNKPGGNPGNQPANPQKPKFSKKIHKISENDSIADRNIQDITRREQVENTCTLYGMEYIGQMIDKNNYKTVEDIIKYFKLKEKDVRKHGLDKSEVDGLVRDLFDGRLRHLEYENEPFNFKECIDNKNVIMTNLDCDQDMAHNIVIIGYTSDKYIYIDPNDKSNFYECDQDYIDRRWGSDYCYEIIIK